MIQNTRPFWRVLARARQQRSAFNVAVADQSEAQVRDVFAGCDVPFNADTCRAAILGAVSVMCSLTERLNDEDRVDNSDGSALDLACGRTLVLTCAALLVFEGQGEGRKAA